MTLRRAATGDEPFLRRLYAELRAPEFAALGLDPAALDALLAMQHQAQDRAHRARHPGADIDLVVLDGRPAGRLVVDRTAAAIHVVDITLAREDRGGGVGTVLLQHVIDEGRRSGRPVTLQVLRVNPAVRLYRRLGFAVCGEDEVHLMMECPSRATQLNTAW
ncbi:MAG: GNAT family N-acetyltransferase [Solirubrobacteraceae bacterium]